MKKLLIMDEKNYSEGLEEIYRIAVRGIILSNGKLLMIESDDGELKFPGGGTETGENDIQTLIRETSEETGFTIIPETIQEFGEIDEKRLAFYENKIWHQINRYYFCRIYNKQSECSYSENEKAHGFKPVWYSLDEAVDFIENKLIQNGKQSCKEREYNVLKLLGDFLGK